MLCVFCFAFCVAFCVAFYVVFAFTVWRIVGRGENPAGPGTSVSGGVRKRSVFKLSWPSTAEYRMMKLKKKDQEYTIFVDSQAAMKTQDKDRAGHYPVE